jgi:hypothetical protein
VPEQDQGMIVRIAVEVSNIHESDRKTNKIDVIADTGSTYCWIPKDELRKIGILEKGKRIFKTISSEKESDPLVTPGSRTMEPLREVRVVFAEPNYGIVLGAFAMEGMGLKVNPKNGRIIKENVFLAL